MEDTWKNITPACGKMHVGEDGRFFEVALSSVFRPMYCIVRLCYLLFSL